MLENPSGYFKRFYFDSIEREINYHRVEESKLVM